MDLITLALVVLVVVAVVVLVRRRNRAPKPAAAPPRGDDGVPTFRVVTLGPRGSGKTLLLASMYHQMQTWGGRGYFLAAPREQVALLNHWFTEVEDPGRDWPAGTATADTREFAFDVRTRGGSGGCTRCSSWSTWTTRARC